MDDRARSRDDVLILRALGIASVVLVPSACAPPPPAPVAPRARPVAASLPAAPARPPAADPDFPVRPDYATHLSELARGVSRGHGGGRYDMRLFANASAAAAFRARARSMPPGALFAAAHSEGGRAGPLLVMQKRAPGYDAAHGDWYYAVADDAARRVLRQGRLGDCSGCHSTSPTDYVFTRVEAVSAAK